jgi:asparagine N-glycosylation enzyme membrane subunit Stt3
MPSSRAVAILVVVVAAGFLIRCVYLREVFLDGRVVPFDPDSYYHLWRIEETAHTGAPPHFDRFTNAPEGAQVLYPDGFDGGMGWVVRLCAGASASRFALLVLSLFAQPLGGALALLGVFWLARRAADGPTALLATAIAALLPSHVLGGFLGRVDHHVFEIALPPLIVVTLLGDGRERLRAVGAGLLLALLAATTMTAVLHGGVIALALAIAGLREERARRFAITAAAFAIAAILLAPSAIRTGGFAFDAQSALTATLFAACAAAMATVALLGRERKQRLRVALAVGAIGAIAMVALSWKAILYVAGPSYNAMFTEAQPIWRDPWGAVEHYSLALPLAPVALVLLARGTPAQSAVAVMGLAGLTFTFGQGRFEWFVPSALPIALAWLAVIAWRRWPRARVLTAIAGVAALAPPVEFLARSHLHSRKTAETIDASEWLHDHTPPVGERRGREPTPWTVLAPSDFGNYIAWWGERPVVATSFQNQDYARGFVDQARIFYGDADAEPLLDRRRVRWLVAPAQDVVVEGWHRSLLLDLGAAQSPTLYRRLFMLDGSAVRSRDGVMLPALGRWRLVYESALRAKADGADVPAVKIFERVAGARLTGACSATVLLESAPRVGERTLDWRSFADCSDGRFVATVPYPGRVTLRRGAAVSSLELDETDVRDGRERSSD